MKASIGLAMVLAVAAMISASQAAEKPKLTGSVKAGPVSVSPDGTKCFSVPLLPISPAFCGNKKTGESSWGVSTPVGSLQLGGKGTDGKNNFIKVTGGAPTPVTPQVGVKIPTPCLTRAGMTSATTLENKRK